MAPESGSGGGKRTGRQPTAPSRHGAPRHTARLQRVAGFGDAEFYEPDPTDERYPKAWIDHEEREWRRSLDDDEGFQAALSAAVAHLHARWGGVDNIRD